MKDKVITCIQCESPFVFTASQQARFAAQGFDEPKRCPECRKKKTRAIEVNGTGRGEVKKKRNRRKDSYEFL